ncbi:hypothetical protein AVEN_106141-1 [Araneus ventricosus]|uniref:Uncharacterized protein n=1 Tax=Araneus ventricosus TaxID=182803 RepID=A0A4Y2FIQ2_ARAVE|nr:hypothetical protein AVEN_106141-1 [Araneus ventricosus]
MRGHSTRFNCHGGRVIQIFPHIKAGESNSFVRYPAKFRVTTSAWMRSHWISKLVLVGIVMWVELAHSDNGTYLVWDGLGRSQLWLSGLRFQYPSCRSRRSAFDPDCRGR